MSAWLWMLWNPRSRFPRAQRQAGHPNWSMSYRATSRDGSKRTLNVNRDELSGWLPSSATPASKLALSQVQKGISRPEGKGKEVTVEGISTSAPNAFSIRRVSEAHREGSCFPRRDSGFLHEADRLSFRTVSSECQEEECDLSVACHSNRR